ncbi:MAG: MFS transporter [Spirochaetes bacterium]|nr:MFS transporter [Spirochaetota bacterium]
MFEGGKKGDRNAAFHRNVYLTGLTSFFTDVSSEMIYPLLQAFVSMTLSAQRALIGPILGIMEGVAESAASLLKVLSGYYSDRWGNRKAPAIGGYSLSAASKLLLLAATAGWYFVLSFRFLDRVGKGVRSAPRDALISESTPAERQGAAFGLQRGMDFAGALVGSVALYLLALRFIDPATGNLRSMDAFFTIFLISLVPASIGVVFLFFVREKRQAHEAKDRPRPSLRMKGYDRNLKVFFAAQFLFTLGNSSNQFLLLRSMNLGHALSTTVLMYIAFNLTTTLLSAPFGALSDRVGRKRILLAGYSLYAGVYLAFGFITGETGALLWLFWPVYGVYYAMTEGVEKAFVSDIAPAGSKATALGFYHTITGIGLLPASIIAGFLFTVHPSAPFIFGGATSVLSVALLAAGTRDAAREACR